ncbi:MAG: hypothetical protein WDA60_10045 [Acidimicrobiia bacterium]
MHAAATLAPPLVAAEFGAGAVALLVTGAAVAVVAAVLFAMRWVTSLPDLPPPGPETSEPGPEPPALANLLLNRCRVTTAAAAATLLDLAARRWLALFQAGPGEYVVRVQPSRDEPLTPYERQVLDLVREKAVGGSAPMAAIQLDADAAGRWRSDFADKVLDDAKQRGLVQRRWNRTDARDMGVLAAVALFLIAAGLYFAKVQSASPSKDSGFARDDWFLVAGGLWLALMAGLAALRSVRYAPAGEAAAARWLGFKQFLRAQEGFGDATPAAVAIWNRLLAYGAGVGAARGALDGIPLEVEDPDVAWSRYDGQWRQVRVEYPQRFGYGERPVVVLGGGVLRLVLWGGVGFAVLPIVADFLWSVASDALDGSDSSNPGAWLGIAFAVVFGALGACVLARITDGLVRAYRGLMDLQATSEVTGAVVKHHRTGDEDSGVRHWFAVDPGGVEEVRAYWVAGGALPRRGSTVTVVVTPHLHHLVSVTPIVER